jgi:hypothetical protein
MQTLPTHTLRQKFVELHSTAFPMHIHEMKGLYNLTVVSCFILYYIFHNSMTFTELFAIKHNKISFERVTWLTVMVPRSKSVGSGPTENIILRIVDATSVRTPDSRGSVITMATDTNITAQIKPEKCCPSSRRIRTDNYSQWCKPCSKDMLLWSSKSTHHQ